MKRFITLIALCAFSAVAVAGDLLSGSGAPGAGLGVDGDHYFRTDTSQLYKKASGAWLPVAARLAVKGDKGDRGESGQRGLGGPIGPAGPGLRTFPNNTTLTAATPQYVGQLALQTDTNALYRGTGTMAGNWTLIPTQGAAGLKTFPNTGARNATAPDFIGQLGLELDNVTLWRGTALTTNAWAPFTVEAVAQAVTYFAEGAELTTPGGPGQLALQGTTDSFYLNLLESGPTGAEWRTDIKVPLAQTAHNAESAQVAYGLPVENFSAPPAAEDDFDAQGTIRVDGSFLYIKLTAPDHETGGGTWKKVALSAL